jgi:hypothetical protein
VLFLQEKLLRPLYIHPVFIPNGHVAGSDSVSELGLECVLTKRLILNITLLWRLRSAILAYFEAPMESKAQIDLVIEPELTPDDSLDSNKS